MQKTIPIGVEFYKEMIDKDYYYVDKTLLVKSIFQQHHPGTGRGRRS